MKQFVIVSYSSCECLYHHQFSQFDSNYYLFLASLLCWVRCCILSFFLLRKKKYSIHCSFLLVRTLQQFFIYLQALEKMVLISMKIHSLFIPVLVYSRFSCIKLATHLEVALEKNLTKLCHLFFYIVEYEWWATQKNITDPWKRVSR